MSYRIPILQTILLRIREKSRNTHIALNSQINKTMFEGDNYVGKKCVVNNCTFGKFSYIAAGGEIYRTRVGRYTSIGPSCKIIYGNHPVTTFVSTHPAFYSPLRPAGRSFVSKGKYDELSFVNEKKEWIVDIGNDVWIASNVSILGGITIGDGAVVATGSVVTKSIQPYSIVGGVPARVIKYRFSPQQIDWLLKLQWWNKEEDWIREYAEAFENIDELKILLEEKV